MLLLLIFFFAFYWILLKLLGDDYINFGLCDSLFMLIVRSLKEAEVHGTTRDLCEIGRWYDKVFPIDFFIYSYNRLSLDLFLLLMLLLWFTSDIAGSTCFNHKKLFHFNDRHDFFFKSLFFAHLVEEMISVEHNHQGVIDTPAEVCPQSIFKDLDLPEHTPSLYSKKVITIRLIAQTHSSFE